MSISIQTKTELLCTKLFDRYVKGNTTSHCTGVTHIHINDEIFFSISTIQSNIFRLEKLLQLLTDFVNNYEDILNGKAKFHILKKTFSFNKSIYLSNIDINSMINFIEYNSTVKFRPYIFKNNLQFLGMTTERSKKTKNYYIDPLYRSFHLRFNRAEVYFTRGYFTHGVEIYDSYYRLFELHYILKTLDENYDYIQNEFHKATFNYKTNIAILSNNHFVYDECKDEHRVYPYKDNYVDENQILLTISYDKTNDIITILSGVDESGSTNIINTVMDDYLNVLIGD